MKTTFTANRNQGLTLIEVFVICLVLVVLVVLLIPSLSRAKARALRISCVCNLKQNGLGFRIWSGDNTNHYPMAVSETNGGTMEFTTGPNVFRHFQVMSNELSTPIVLVCPSEASDLKSPATNFVYLRNSNISYFVGVDADESNPQMILAGDHNITNGTPIKNGILELTTNHLSGWTSEMHNKVGNVCLADGSVQQLSITGLQNAVANTGLATNRLQMP